ncbi:MAG TPA: YceI family protein [Methylomirabilota bacterium]|nr:YceI family protein [Methylomirabilota bacterium]
MPVRTTSVLVLALWVALSAAAERIRVELRPDATTIGFELSATMHTVHGTADLEGGTFTVDTATGAASGEAVVAAASVDTGNKKRDKKMHGEVLLSERHPRIVLRAERLEGELAPAGTSEVTVVGTLELLGQAYPIEIPITVAIDGDRATVDASFLVPYVAWGLTDPSTFLLRVSKEVPVTVTAQNVSVTPIPADGGPS